MRKNIVILANEYNKPYHLSVRYDNNKVGIRLFANKKDGVNWSKTL